MSAELDSATSGCPCTTRAYSIALPKSPIANPLRSSTIPSPTERYDTRVALSQVHHSLAELDDALAHLESVKKQLLSKRHAFQAFSDVHTGLLSSLRLMPAEIFGEIFSFLKAGYQEIPSSRSHILLPTHVCQYWRQIALSTPSLWTEITIDLGYRTDIVPELESVQAWLTRSRDCPLSINLQSQYSQSEEAWNDVLGLLLPHARRWRHVIISLRFKIDLSSVKHLLIVLETLELRDNDMQLEGQETLLSMTPNIVSLEADLYGSTIPQAPRNDSPLRLCKLENLKLSYKSGSSLFDCLELPWLTSFEICGTGDDESLDLNPWESSLESLIRRSACSIRSLRLSPGNVSGRTSLEDLIRITPELELLHIDPVGENGWGPSGIFEALTASTGRLHVPRLHTMTMAYTDNFRVQPFMEMVGSRARGKNPDFHMKSFKLYHLSCAWNRVFDGAATKRLGEIASEGLEIAVQGFADDYSGWIWYTFE
ncbi:hypothetical protein HWV62_10082 [Athelia sp. TMB]|nr:hypothetical protein HWV62_10082 [Athelia sp. TMB]